MPALGDVMRKLNPWYHEDEPPAPPPISTAAASVLVVVYALVYFLPFYASPTTRPSPTLSRDAPSVIRARIRSVSISCLLCCAATLAVLTRGADASPADALHLMGLWPPALADTARAVLLTALLFAGPLFAYFVVDVGWREWLRLEPVLALWEDWMTWRNIVAGPVTEEVLFRAASVPLMLVARTPVRQTIFLSPVLFGLAHVHHFYEFRLTQPQVPVAAAVLRSVFQLSFTTLFGAYATFLFVRTGSLPAVCAVHAFCNCMGLPRLWGRVQPQVPDDDPAPLRRRHDEQRPSTSAVWLWTAAYYVLLVAGATAWWKNIWALTESPNALVSDLAFTST
ncbi:hypothetical protein B0T24DRAFT_180056 [Lasiosphaeria ovina]|uniref:intramembrane prenyl-peptidase Rce1 n=1 Tax=Lasiosphaeria ovina TaxID=92902 RepID=A0AAE0NEJ7_9PEZI|nr:hypothetical protein B0T24DRAFT_180056 [Lasiosphaeria ovina]